jgi:hypothetical protein
MIAPARIITSRAKFKMQVAGMILMLVRERFFEHVFPKCYICSDQTAVFALSRFVRGQLPSTEIQLGLEPSTSLSGHIGAVTCEIGAGD